MGKYLVINEEAVSQIWLGTRLYIRKIFFSFWTVYCGTNERQLKVQILSLKTFTLTLDGSLFACKIHTTGKGGEGYKEMRDVVYLADQYDQYEPKYGESGGRCWVSAKEYSCTQEPK